MNILGNSFHQIAYVTNNFDMALQKFADLGVTRFLELRDISFPIAHDGTSVNCHIALGRSGGMEIEIIEPLSDNAAIYREPLTGDGFAMKLHHVAQRFDTSDAFEAQRKKMLDDGTRLPIDGASNGMTYFYADFRDSLGHYVEYIFGSPEYWAQMKDAIPEN